MDMKNWAEMHQSEIDGYLQKKDYTGLFLVYSQELGYSQKQLAKHFKCSRRAIKRYLSGIRQVPMAMVSVMLEKMEYDVKNHPCNTYEDDDPVLQKDSEEVVDSTPSNCLEKGETDIQTSVPEFSEDGVFIWYGDEDILVNVLYAIRTIQYKESRFEAACRFNIQEDVLFQYEHGLKRISIPDIKKILEGYQLKLDQLFVNLVSYDGGKTYVPLRIARDVVIGDQHFDLSNDFYDMPGTMLYQSESGDPVNGWYLPPVQRYSAVGEPLYKCLPDELTMDEFYNTNDLFFDIEKRYSEPEYKGLKIPPVYTNMQGNSKKYKRWGTKTYPYPTNIKSFQFNDDYTITIDWKGSRRGGMLGQFDLSEYIFSDSPWYSMLRDPDYFKRGILTYIGEAIPQNRSFLWKDGQYIRIIELYMSKYPSKRYSMSEDLIENGRYDNWTKYTDYYTLNPTIGK